MHVHVDDKTAKPIWYPINRLTKIMLLL